MKTRFLLSVLLIFLTSCETFKNFSNDYDEPKVRIVDLNGKPGVVELKTPRANFDALHKQQNLTSEKLVSQPPYLNQETITAQNKYANPSQVNYQDLNRQPNLTRVNSYQLQENDLAKIEEQKLNSMNQAAQIKEIEYDLGNEDIYANEIKNETSKETFGANMNQAQNNIQGRNLENSEQNMQSTQISEAKVKYNFAGKSYKKSDLAVNSSSQKYNLKAGNSGIIAKKAKNTAKKPAKTNNSGQYFVQSGSFTNQKRANEQLGNIQELITPKDRVKLMPAMVNNKQYYRIVTGPFSDKEKAENVLKQLRQRHENSILIKK